MKNNNNHFISIVICTYNRAFQLENCIRSLLEQDFPINSYEVIVINDGSSDDTEQLLVNFKITAINHKANKGISFSRNSGLKIAKGDIYVCFDDDCIAKKDWLKNLIKVYEKNDIVGVGSVTELPQKASPLEKFVDMNYLKPAPLTYGISKNPLVRFIVYLKSMFSTKTLSEIYEVYELYGFSSSFRTEVLKSVNGWDESIDAAEDVDICKRIKNKFPESKFYLSNRAIIIHDHRMSLSQFLAKPYKRGLSNLIYYLRNNIFPPLFPFPFIIFLVTIPIFFQNIIFAFISLIFSIQFFYIWWLIKLIKEKNISYFLFPYYQFLYETMVNIGILKGLIIVSLNKSKYI